LWTIVPFLLHDSRLVLQNLKEMIMSEVNCSAGLDDLVDLYRITAGQIADLERDLEEALLVAESELLPEDFGRFCIKVNLTSRALLMMKLRSLARCLGGL
jgi:hypothetical protein